jgi:hypothetical protein
MAFLFTMKTNLTYERASELLRYDAQTGTLSWRVNRRGTAKAGSEAGCIAYANGLKKTPYICIRVDGKRYFAHRIAWLLHYGEFPGHEIDHIDGCGLNNRIDNLRDVPNSINSRNSRMQRNNTSGITGVFWYKRYEKWLASVRIDSKTKFIGYFADLSDAETAVREFRAKHGFTERHGEAG